MHNTLKALLAATSLLAAQAAVAGPCFELLNGAGDLVQRSGSSPIDLSLTISQGLAAKGLNGYHLTMFDAVECQELGTTPEPATGAPGQRAHLPRGGTITRLQPGPYAAMAQASDAAWRSQEQHGKVLAALAERYRAQWAAGAGARASEGGGCDGRTLEVGPRGGVFCITASGRKQYLSSLRR